MGKRGEALQERASPESAADTKPLFRGALSLAEHPSLAEQSPGLFCNSHPAERTAYKHFGSCENVCQSVSHANKGLCPFESCKPFFEGFDPKIYEPVSGKSEHSRGSLGGFQAPQRALENTGRSDW